MHPARHIADAAAGGAARAGVRRTCQAIAAPGCDRRGAQSGRDSGLFYAIGAIESVCAQLACANFTELEIENVVKLHKRLVLYARGQQPSEDYFRTNQAIHQAIVKGARNAFLAELHNSLSIRILRARFFVDVSKSAWTRALAEHEQIAALVQRRDGRKLSELLLQHMLGSWRDFEVTLDRPKLARSVLVSERRRQLWLD